MVIALYLWLRTVVGLSCAKLSLASAIIFNNLYSFKKNVYNEKGNLNLHKNSRSYFPFLSQDRLVWWTFSLVTRWLGSLVEIGLVSAFSSQVYTTSFHAIRTCFIDNETKNIPRPGKIEILPESHRHFTKTFYKTNTFNLLICSTFTMLENAKREGSYRPSLFTYACPTPSLFLQLF